MLSDPYTGDPVFEATPVVSRFPPPIGPPPLKHQGDRYAEPRFSNKREAPSPSVADKRQKPAISRTLSSPKMAIANLLHQSDSLYRSSEGIPPLKTSVNWCDAPAQRKDALIPGKDLVLRLLKVSGRSSDRIRHNLPW